MLLVDLGVTGRTDTHVSECPLTKERSSTIRLGNANAITPWGDDLPPTAR